MGKSDSESGKSRGQPPNGADPLLNFRSPAALTARIDAWAAAQPGPKPSRSEAVRRLVEKGLASEGVGADAGFIPLEQLNASNDE